MNEKMQSEVSLLAGFISFFVLGLLLLLAPNFFAGAIHLIISLSTIFISLIFLVFSTLKKKNVQNILLSISTLVVGVFFYFNPQKMLALFPITFGLYMFVNGLIKFTIAFLYRYRGFDGFLRMFIFSIIDFAFAYVMILFPIRNISTLTFISSLYLFGVSLTFLYDYLRELFPKQFTGRRHIRINLPIIFSVFIPYTVYTKINKFLTKYETPVVIKNKEIDDKVDLEIFIHVKETNIGKFGHADLSFDGKVYSYGCYDERSKRLFDLIGEGTLFEIDNPEDYIKFCTKHSNKTIFVFGLSLTKKQKENVHKELEKVKSYTYRWKCDQELDLSKRYDDYASILYRYTKAKFYKFNKSTYKLYYLLWTNCVKLVDKVLASSGSDVIRLNGVITPGAYYHYLDGEFKRKNSNVISKNIYTDTDNKELKELVKIK